jgi:hypothetical protein
MSFFSLKIHKSLHFAGELNNLPRNTYIIYITLVRYGSDERIGRNIRLGK